MCAPTGIAATHVNGTTLGVPAYASRRRVVDATEASLRCDRRRSASQGQEDFRRMRGTKLVLIIGKELWRRSLVGIGVFQQSEDADERGLPRRVHHRAGSREWLDGRSSWRMLIDEISMAAMSGEWLDNIPKDSHGSTSRTGLRAPLRRGARRDDPLLRARRVRATDG